MKSNFQFPVSSFKCIGMAVCAALIFYLVPVQAAGLDYDLGIRQEDLTIVPAPSQLISGQKARIYAFVHNFGSEDMRAAVLFYQGPYALGDPQPVSLRSRGFADEVFVDFTVPNVPFSILVKVQEEGAVLDQNPANNEALSPVIEPLPDRDGDGIADFADNCVSVSSSAQDDSDGDGQGDVCDLDDDNDGLSDIDEQARGTDPFNPDSDADGVSDRNDARPLKSDPSPLSGSETMAVPPAAGQGASISELSVDDNQEPSELEDGEAADNASADFGGVADDTDIAEAQYEIMVPADKSLRIPPGKLPKLWLAAGLSALIAGMFSFLALRMKTPRE